MPTPTIHPRWPLSALIYGPSKAGKSLLSVSTRPPRLLMDAENAAAHLPIQPHPGRPGPDGKPSNLWNPVDPWPEADGTWDTLVVKLRTWQDATTTLRRLQQDVHPIRSVMVDSISELQWKLIEFISGIEQTQLQDWGKIYKYLGSFCRGLRDLTDHPTNVIDAIVVTATARTTEVGGKMIQVPFAQGQAAGQLPYLFDLIGYLDKKEVLDPNRPGMSLTERYLYTREQVPKTFIAGERVNGRLDPKLQLPQVVGTLEQIRQKNTTFRAMQKMVWGERTNTVIEATKPIEAEIPVAVAATSEGK